MANEKTFFKGIQVPRDIKFSELGSKTITMKVSNPEKDMLQSNMQDDVAAFEAWSLILREECKTDIEMTFNILPHWESAFNPEEMIDVNTQHFMRFLFRVWKFMEQFEWFYINKKDCYECIERYKDRFQNTPMVNNIPLQTAGLKKKYDLSEEHILENIFTHSKDASKCIDILVGSQDIVLPDQLYNQLPNGLFIKLGEESNKKTISEIRRVFPTGYFDLWGINRDNELCIFELKNQVNLKAGIISELYFYANYANEVFLTDRFNKGNSTHRGYDVLKKAVERGIPKIHACFLAPEYHSEIYRRRNGIHTHLNKRTDKIAYHFLRFEQEAITKLSGCLPSK